MGKSNSAVMEPASEQTAEALPQSQWKLDARVHSTLISATWRQDLTPDQLGELLGRAYEIVGSEEERYERFTQTPDSQAYAKTRAQLDQQEAYFTERRDALAAAKADPMAEGALATLRECSLDGNAEELVLSSHREAARNAFDNAARALTQMSSMECLAKRSELLAEREVLLAKLTALASPLLDELAFNAAMIDRTRSNPAVHKLGERP